VLGTGKTMKTVDVSGFCCGAMPPKFPKPVIQSDLTRHSFSAFRNWEVAMRQKMGALQKWILSPSKLGLRSPEVHPLKNMG